MKLDVDLNDYLRTGLAILKTFYVAVSMFFIYSFMPELMAFIAAGALMTFNIMFLNYNRDALKIAKRKRKSGYGVDHLIKVYRVSFWASVACFAVSFYGLLLTVPFLEMMLVNVN